MRSPLLALFLIRQLLCCDTFVTPAAVVRTATSTVTAPLSASPHPSHAPTYVCSPAPTRIASVNATIATSALLIVSEYSAWTSAVANGMAPFANSAARFGMDVWVLLVTDSPSRIGAMAWQCGPRGGHPPAPLPHAHFRFASHADVRAVYRGGFHSFYMSNHWNAMLFWQLVGKARYRRLWTVEPDVRAVGVVDLLFKSVPAVELVTTTRVVRLPRNHGATLKWKGRPPRRQYHAWRQITAFSARLLDHMHERFFHGRYNGQDEAVIPTAAAELRNSTRVSLEELGFLSRDGFTTARKARGKVLGLWRHAAAVEAKRISAGERPTARLTLFHPVKDG